MSFAVPADAYDRFMGRYSSPLAPLFADFGERRGAGGTVARRRLRPGRADRRARRPARRRRRSTAVDPSEPFVAAARERHPDVDVRQASAEELPFADGTLRPRARPARRPLHGRPGRRASGDGARHAGGRLVAACVWDHGGGTGPLSPFWDAVHALDPARARRVRAGGLARGPPDEAVRRGRARARSRRSRSRSRSSTRPSTSGGSRSRSASAPPAATCQPRRRWRAPRSGSAAAQRSATAHSWSRPAPGRPARGDEFRRLRPSYRHAGKAIRWRRRETQHVARHAARPGHGPGQRPGRRDRVLQGQPRLRALRRRPVRRGGPLGRGDARRRGRVDRPRQGRRALPDATGDRHRARHEGREGRSRGARLPWRASSTASSWAATARCRCSSRSRIRTGTRS